MSNVKIVRHSDNMVTDEYSYRKEFHFQRLTKNATWYVTYNNRIITHGMYRNDLQEWIDVTYFDGKPELKK